MKRLEDVAPAHAVGALSGILELQSVDPTASTTIRSVDEAIERHVADSLVALPVLGSPARIADLGSGAGWPGLALAAALPDAEVWLVESAIRHCRYLARAVEVGGLSNVHVVHSRIEEWTWTGDLVTARALAALPVLLEYAAPLLVVGGRAVFWKGAVAPDEERAGLRAAEVLGLSREAVHAVTPYEGARDHTLHVFTKVAETPERFPRRAGMAVKRPLG